MKFPFDTILLLTFSLVSVIASVPKIDQNPNSALVNVSDPVTLECRATGDPAPKITWFKDGQPLNIASSSSKYTLIHDSNLFIFSAALGKANKSDSGTYYCRAENEHGQAYSTNATLTITYLKDDFRQVPKSRQVNSGSMVLMECKAPKGHPEAVVSWEKNAQPIRHTHQYHQSQIFPNGTLIINNASLYDNGEYICVAKNDAGQRRSPPAHLNVFEKPSFVLQPDNSKYQLGSKVELKCQASGFPKPQIEWKKDSSFENLPLKAQIRDSSLIIPDVQVDDEGEYTCVATNQLASVESKSYLIVYEKPVFVKSMSNFTIGIETKSLTIECNARGRPQPIIYWAKSASQSSNDQSASASLSSSSSSSSSITQDDFIILENGNLFIERLSKKYEGTYLCQASNEYGNIETKTYLQVKSIQLKPPPVIVYQPQNQTIPINTQANLECVSSNPSSLLLDPLNQFDELQYDAQLSDKIKIQWLKNNQLINLGYDNLKYRLLDSGTLEINSVQKVDSGAYKCAVSNSFGKTSSIPAQLTVENPNNQYVEFQRNHEATALPSAPAQPIVFKISSKSVSLSWQASSHSGHSPIRAYMLEYFSPEWPDTLPGWTVLSDEIPAHVNSFIVENLSPDTYYMFMVRARNDQGYGPPSQVSDLVRTQFEPMFVFSNKNSNELIEKALTGEIIQLNEPPEVLSSSSINVTWKLFKSAYLIQGFYVKYKPIGSRDYQIDTLNTNKQNYYLLSNLAKFTAYEILVEPFSGSIKASESNVIQAKTNEDAPSHSPVSLHVDLDSLQSISIKWQPPPQNHMNGIIIGYKISCLANETKYSLNLNTNSTTRAIILGNLIENMKYCVKVSAYTKIGVGPFTAPKCVEMTFSNLVKTQHNLFKKEPHELENVKHASKLELLIQETWFLIVVSVLIGVLIFSCVAYFAWTVYKRRIIIKKSNSKKYLSNNSTLSNQKIDQNGNRYKLVGNNNDTQIWLDTLHSSSNHSNQDQCCCVPDLAQNNQIFVQSIQNQNPSLDKKTLKSLTSQSPGPQYAEIYASGSNQHQSANPYATTGLFMNGSANPNANKNEPNLYNILNYQANRTMPNMLDSNLKYSSYTIKLLNEANNTQKTSSQQIDQKKLLKYIQATQSQTNTPKVQIKNLQNQNRVKSVESSHQSHNCCPSSSSVPQAQIAQLAQPSQQVNLTQQQLISYLVDLQQNHHYHLNHQNSMNQQPTLPVGPPPSLPQAILTQQQQDFNFINNNPYNLPWTDQNTNVNQGGVFQRVMTSSSNTNSSNSNSSSLISNLTGNSTLSRCTNVNNNNGTNSPSRLAAGSTFTAQQYINRTLNQHHLHKQFNLPLSQQQQIQQQQDYSSISPEDEILSDEFRFIQQQQNQSKFQQSNVLRRDSINSGWVNPNSIVVTDSSSSYRDQSEDVNNSAITSNNSNSIESDKDLYQEHEEGEVGKNQDENENYLNNLVDQEDKRFMFLNHHHHLHHNHHHHPNELYISDEMVAIDVYR